MINRNIFLYTPIIIFSSVWGFTIFLYLLNPFDLETIRIYTALVMVIGISMVYFGFLTPKFLTEGFSIKKNFKSFDEYPFEIKKIKSLVIILTIISFIGTLGNLNIILNAVGGVSNYITRPDQVRKIIIDIYIGTNDVPINKALFKIFSYMTSLISLTVILAGAVSTKKGMKFISILPLVLVLIISISSFQRYFFVQHFFYWIISSFVFLYYMPSNEQKKSFKTFLCQVFSFIIISFIFGVLILVFRLMLKAGVDMKMIFNSLYFYVAGNVFWLDKYLMTNPEPYLGLSIFRSFIKWFVAFGMMDKSAILSPNYEFYKLYNIEGNTFGFFRVPYEDFGIIGIMTIPYIWGWIGYFTMKKYVQRFTLVRLGAVAFVLFSFFLSFFGFTLLAFTSMAWMLFLLSLLDKYLFIKKN